MMKKINWRTSLAGGTLGLLGLFVSPAIANEIAAAPVVVEAPYEVGLRVAAEWEPAIGALVGWPLALPDQLIVDIAKKEKVFVVIGSYEEQSQADEKFSDLGINSAQIEYILHSNVSEEFNKDGGPQWTRDWGPFGRFSAEGNFSLADARFLDYPYLPVDCVPMATSYEPETNDAVVEEMAAQMGVDRTEVPLYLTGGNIMFDGRKTAMVTCALIHENESQGITEDQLKEELRERLGVERLLTIPNFEDYGIQHIDCLLKFINEETVLVARPPVGHPHFDRYEEIVAMIKTMTSGTGRFYSVKRIDAGEVPTAAIDIENLFVTLLEEGFSEEEAEAFIYELEAGAAPIAAYTNSLILNKRIFVPLFSVGTDDAALESWRSAMPGYEVTGYTYGEDVNPMNPFRSFDALHCRTRAIWDPKMLFMTHNPIADQPVDAWNHKIKVTIKDYSNEGLVKDELSLMWRVQGDEYWYEAPLRNRRGSHDWFNFANWFDNDNWFNFDHHENANRSNIYTGKVSLFNEWITPEAGMTIEYYFTAADYSGREDNLPRTAPDAYYSFKLID